MSVCILSNTMLIVTTRPKIEVACLVHLCSFNILGSKLTKAN
uniref:Uncharacterized protein n=1 Tax=Arundo donax TaxID=35708 RepID=A0A0A9BEC6_ARUDO